MKGKTISMVEVVARHTNTGMSGRFPMLRSVSPFVYRMAYADTRATDSYEITYTVDESRLTMNCEAETDTLTFIDMTNHVYWDLSGRFDGRAMEQSLQIAADSFIRNDDVHLPQSICAVCKSAFDFSEPVSPATMMARFPQERQFAIANGFNNAFLLNKDLQEALGFSARLTSTHSSLSMTMQTNQPAIVFYSRGFLNDATPLEHGPSVPGCALALEAQGIPDLFHLTGNKPQCLKPGEHWERFISWEIHGGCV